MAETFAGNWVVEVFQKDAAFSQRFIIEGSNGSDGVYAGETSTPPVSVSGANWSIRFEWNNNAGSGWQASEERRNGATYTLAEGLVVFLGADDNVVHLRDHDFNDVVLRCRNVDPELNPWLSVVPYDFTLPEDVRQKGRKPKDRIRPRDNRGDDRIAATTSERNPGNHTVRPRLKS